MTIKKIIFGVLFAGYLFFIVNLVKLYLTTPNFFIQTDLVSFLTGAKIIKDGKVANLYDINTQYEFQNLIVFPDQKNLLPFRNFPITAVTYIPLLNMDLKSSYIAIFIINFFLLGLFTFLTLYCFPNLRKNVVFYFLPFFFWPSVNSLIVGQFTPILFLICFAIYLLLRKERSFYSGLLTSALAIKPQYLLFAPFSFGLSTDKKRFAIGFITGILAFVVINLVITKNVKPYFDYFAFVFNTENPDFGSRPYQMYTFYGTIKHFFPKLSTNIFIIFNMFCYFISVAVLLKKRMNYEPKDFFSMGILITILFSVHALTHDLSLMLIPIYFYSAAGLKDKKFTFISYTLFFAGLITLISVSFPVTVIMFFLLLFVFLLNNQKFPYSKKT